jgi:ERO1-like protein alpha
VIISFYKVSTNEECQLTNNNDLIDDCNCRISDINELNNQRLYPLLNQIVKKNYFRFFPVNLRKKCQFWSDDDQCSRRTCAIKSCPIDKLPEALREKMTHSNEDCSTIDTNSTLGLINKNLTEEHKQTIESWIQFDDKQSENFCDVDDETSVDLEYIDLSINHERYTGYTGPSTQRIWSAIYNENCFFLPDSKIFYDLRQKRLNADKMCLEGRTFYRLISGLHTSITIHLCAQYFFPTLGGGYSGTDGRWGPNFDEFKYRFDSETTDGEGQKWLKNVYFIYLIELRAIYKAREFFKDQKYFTGNEIDDLQTKELIINQLLKEIEPFANYFNEHNLFQNGNELLKIEFKEHFRNISHIMDCVGCDKCKLWGKLQVQALGMTKRKMDVFFNCLNLVFFSGTALKILFSENPVQLQRSEIVSLINGFNRLSTSLYHLEHTFKTCIKKGI